MRVLVCGGRNIGRVSRSVSLADTGNDIQRATQERQFVANKMTELHAEKKFSEIIGGEDGGAERICTTWARLNGVPLTIFERKDRRESIIDRNLRMLEASSPELLIAFGGGESTNALLSEAKKRGIDVLEIQMPVS